MVRFYLGEEPILANVPDLVLRREEDRDYVLAHLEDLVVKEVHGAGGYGMLIGPGRDASTSSRTSAPIIATPGALHRAADARAVDLPDVGRAAGSRRGTSTCGPSCSRAAR